MKNKILDRNEYRSSLRTIKEEDHKVHQKQGLVENWEVSEQAEENQEEIVGNLL